MNRYVKTTLISITGAIPIVTIFAYIGVMHNWTFAWLSYFVAILVIDTIMKL